MIAFAIVVLGAGRAGVDDDTSASGRYCSSPCRASVWRWWWPWRLNSGATNRYMVFTGLCIVWTAMAGAEAVADSLPSSWRVPRSR